MLPERRQNNGKTRLRQNPRRDQNSQPNPSPKKRKHASSLNPKSQENEKVYIPYGVLARTGLLSGCTFPRRKLVHLQTGH